MAALLLPLLFLLVESTTFIVDTKSTPINFPHLWESSVGSCHATTALRQDWRHQITTVRNDLGINMVRFHGLFDDDMSVVLPDGSFSFFNIDQVFDFIVSIGMKPYVELSFMPEVYASGTQTVFHYKGNITPPQNYADWNKLISTFAQHLLDRYGSQEVYQWYFEVWNEPNCGFFYECCCCGDGCGNQTAYFTLYQNTANALKAIDKNLRVGGPSTAQLQWIPDFLQFTSSNSVPVDFVSSHLYPTDPEVAPNKTGFSDAIAAAAQQAAAGSVPLLLSEYNSGLGLQAADLPYSSAFMVYEALALSQVSNLGLYSYWTFSDIFEEQGQSSLPFQDGFGLQTIYGIPKPVYRAFQILHGLGTQRLNPTVTAPSTAGLIATTSGNVLTLLAFNYDYISQPITPQTVNITLTNVATSLAPTADMRRIDDNHANPITVWKSAGQPEYPSQQLINQMMEASQLVVEQIPVTSAGGGTYTIVLTLPSYGVAEIKIDL